MRRMWIVLVALIGVWQVALARLPLPKELATRKVDLLVSPEGLSLEDALRALSKTLGVPIFFRELPKDELTISLKGRTLKETLDLLSRVYGDELDYTWLPEKAILVAPKRIVEVMASTPKEEPKQEKPKEKAPSEYIAQAFSAPGLEKGFLDELKTFLPNTAFAYSASSGVLLLSGPPEEIARVSPLLRSLARKEALEVVPVSAPIDGDKLAAVAKALGGEALLVGDRVLLKGERETLEKLKELLKSPIAFAPEPKKEEKPTLLQVFTVPKGREDALASALQDLLPVKAAALAPGQLVVRGQEEAVAQAQALIASIPPEEPAKPKEERAPPVLKVLTVPKGRAEALKASLGELLDLKVSILGEDALALLGPKEAIAQAEAILSALPKETPQKAEKEEDLPIKAYPIYGDPAGVEKALSAAFPKGGFTVVPEAKRVVVRGPYGLHEKVVALLKEVDPPRPEEKKEEEKEAQAEIPLFHLSPDGAQTYLKELGVPVKVVKNPAGNQIWLLGKEKDVAQAVNLLQEADRALPQIRLRVRVVRTSKGGLDELKSSLGTVLDSLRLSLSGDGLTSAFTLPIDLLRTLELKLGALESKSEAKTLINTEVITKDGETAKLTSGGTLTTGLNAPAGGSEGQAMAPNPVSFDYGLSIELKGKVVPNEDRAVDLSVAINLGEPPVPGPIANSIQIAKRTLTTNLRIKDGQGVLLGGLIQETKSAEESGVPILSWIPIIGDLFKTKKDTVQEEGLLILLEGQVESAPTLLPKMVKPAAREGEGASPKEALTDPRTPPTPPTPKPQETQISPARPKAQLAPWARLEAFWREGTLGAYLISTSKTAPLFRVVGAYAQEMDGRFVDLVPKTRSEWILPGKSDVVVLTGGPLQNPYDLTLLLEDELGGRWYVRSPVSFR